MVVNNVILIILKIFSFRDSGESQIEKADEALQKVIKMKINFKKCALISTYLSSNFV